MNVCLSGDWHPDWSTAGFARFEDVEAAAIASADAAIAERCELYLFHGDLCDPDRGRAHEAAALAIRVASKLAKYGVASRWLVGNHDVLEDGTGTSTLEPLVAFAEHLPPGLVVVEKLPRFEHGDRPVDLLALPYVARSHAYDPIAFVEEARARWDGARRVIAFGHLMLEGIGPGSETVDMARGRDIFYPIAELLAAFGDRILMTNGHYHKRQTHRGVQVIGSLERLTFGEEDSEPGWSILRVAS